jgi:hypothetical protein
MYKFKITFCSNLTLENRGKLELLGLSGIARRPCSLGSTVVARVRNSLCIGVHGWLTYGGARAQDPRAHAPMHRQPAGIQGARPEGRKARPAPARAAPRAPPTPISCSPNAYNTMATKQSATCVASRFVCPAYC